VGWIRGPRLDVGHIESAQADQALIRELGRLGVELGRWRRAGVSGEGLSWNWMILLGHRRLQYIGEEPLGVAGG
jgi:hypothetical protein